VYSIELYPNKVEIELASSTEKISNMEKEETPGIM
jgi:hypothetical protein